MLRQKPIRIMGDVKFPVRCSREGTFDNKARAVVLNMLEPIQVLQTMFTQAPASYRNSVEIPWSEEANDVIDNLGREF